MAILLSAGCAQPGEAMAINRTLPGEEFLDRQHIAAAGFFEREEPAANGCNHFGLATNHPTCRFRRREIGNCQRTAVGPDDVLYPQTAGFGHHAPDTSAELTAGTCTPSGLKLD